MNSFKRLSILALCLALSVLGALAASPTAIEVGRAHAATGSFGCTVSGATVATPSVITCSAAHGLIDGDQVQITGIVGTTTDNTTAYVKVTGYSTTTFGLFSDTALAAGVTGTGSYTSGGKVSIADDVSALTGDYTLRLVITGLTAAKNAVVCIQDSADGFASDIVTLACVNPSGAVTSGTPVTYSWRRYQLPSLRIGATTGVTNARLRLNVQSLDTAETVTTSLFLEQ